MASSFQDSWQIALAAESVLSKGLAEKEKGPAFTDLSHFLSEFRIACQNAILLDFDSARNANVEDRLWDAHLKLNTRFRKRLARYREETTKKKPVEKRKLEKHYLDFIKSSQRFYRGYIQHLSSHFGGILELEKVARKFSFESEPFLCYQFNCPVTRLTALHTDLSAQPPTRVSSDLRKRILQSCHATLIRLGDLSRYREAELVSKDRNWGPAIGYYDLASVIYPASGASHNQLAIIALADVNHLRATYHLYRALSAQEPHPSAKGNLEIEFKKVMNAWAKRELIRPEDAGIPGRALAPWFVYLHAQCYKGTDFPEHDELESEVLSQLAVDIRERSLEGTLQKFCLVNIAAEAFARTRAADGPVSNASVFFQRINVKTFFTLLQILLVELERFAVDDPSNKENKNGPDKVTVVARRILPALRHYSSWLLTTSDFLATQKEEIDSSLSIQIKEFWKIYASTLSLLASTFDIVRLPEIDYLLEEDEESLGFAPLDQEATSRRYAGINNQPKPRMNDSGVERSHPNMEMLYRIREFVIDGLDLVVRKQIPVALVDDEDKKTFIFQEEGLPSQFFSSPHGHQQTLSTASIEREDIPRETQDTNSVAEGRSMFGDSQSASVSMSANMNRIVEGVERLVESDTYENPTNDQLSSFLSGAATMPTPTQIGPDANAYPFNDRTPQPMSTPIGPEIGQPAVNTPRAVLSGFPSIGGPSIWSTGSPASASSRGPPPGLSQQAPLNSMATSNMNIQEHSPYRGLAQTRFPDIGSPFSSSLVPSENPSSMAPPVGQRWERNATSRTTFGAFDVPSQPMSTGTTNASWANNAFIGSRLSSGTDLHSSGLNGNRKSGTQINAIGPTPPCGQGG
ncbi:hypothetical protein N7510_002991 [Penicillium lagena]|uniref:uncharacterized protein n=1 Tax=Penicillium lagena TaxID=94218 RepID=UPI00254145BB|nr:uncharacterized protein N7510_002991 [Penicillium lagena]KAJ5619007.1 hypothetical protein N7510_002991 [Penicillium lagena]